MRTADLTACSSEWIMSKCRTDMYMHCGQGSEKFAFIKHWWCFHYVLDSERHMQTYQTEIFPSKSLSIKEGSVVWRRDEFGYVEVWRDGGNARTWRCAIKGARLEIPTHVSSRIRSAPLGLSPLELQDFSSISIFVFIIISVSFSSSLWSLNWFSVFDFAI